MVSVNEQCNAAILVRLCQCIAKSQHTCTNICHNKLSLQPLHTYLVLKIFRLLLFVVAMVNTPKEVMEVILVEFLTVGLIHRFQDFTNGSLGHKLMQL